MTITTLIPPIAGVMFILFSGYIAISPEVSTKKLWILPATLSCLFLAFSIYVILTEGLFGFWTEHITDLWGNQIWLDLLLAVGTGWFFVVPQAKKLGMQPLFWLVLVVSTGSIGLLAMVARLLYLQDASTVTASDAPVQEARK